jgi:mannose/fructose/N-acetylgalactosamine-specific phosphotransferase system component IIC
LFLQGFGIVALTSMNVIAISRHSVGAAMAVTFALNALWWSNAKAANHGGSRWTYASGAACGVALVVWLS